MLLPTLRNAQERNLRHSNRRSDYLGDICKVPQWFIIMRSEKPPAFFTPDPSSLEMVLHDISNWVTFFGCVSLLNLALVKMEKARACLISSKTLIDLEKKQEESITHGHIGKFCKFQTLARKISEKWMPIPKENCKCR